MLSTCLARWGYKIKHIDNRAEPTPTGRADGIQPRSLDLLRNMGLKSAIMAHKPARVFEVAFWDPPLPQAGNDKGKGIVRTGTWASCPAFIDARYPFTTLLHQGLIERVFIADLEKHGVSIQRPWTIQDFRSDEAANPDYPVEVDIAHVDGSARETVRAKYLFSGEGARSFVRDKLGIRITHKDPISHVWGVMDGVVNTDFPDIKMKCTIHSEHGSIMVIPRENDMVRLYIQLASSTDADFNPRKTATEQEVQTSAKKILEPYFIEWERVEWYSVYPIGQGIAEKYTLDHRVFLGGDACHTHSPKAGQGMNTAFLDAQNLAWKLHAVESGFADRALLRTYEPERRAVAESLLNFDNRYAKLFSQRPTTDAVHAATTTTSTQQQQSAAEDNDFIKTFKESCAFTSGYGVAYAANAVNWSSSSPLPQCPRPDLVRAWPRGTRLRPGHLFINADVTRVVDANVVHLEQQIPLNGAFRIFVFAGRAAGSSSPTSSSHARRNKAAAALRDFASHVFTPSSSSSPPSQQTQHPSQSFLTAHLRPDLARVSRHEVLTPHSRFFTFSTVIAAPRASVEIARDVPAPLARYRDLVFADDRVPSGGGGIGSAHAKMGFRLGGEGEWEEGEGEGAVVVVRPDGYVGVVVSLVEGSGTADVLNAYFDSFCAKKIGSSSSSGAAGAGADVGLETPVRAQL
ncbi:hypothetical protein SLS62_002173 [Diatrype stigma]|uniref:Phenol 2-monooxygenase n=1 Tax=Diatrype stigma TaxID=117547 RepID=A0AAN9YSQ8_9PEZI